jgi:hypothetical protein
VGFTMTFADVGLRSGEELISKPVTLILIPRCLGFWYLNGPKTYTRFSNAVYEVKSSDGRVRRFNLAGSQTELAADITAWMQAQRPDINISELQTDLDELVTALKSEYQAELDEAKIAWLLTVLPPFALLGFGLCIFWIARGFRPRTQPLN